jgi:peptide/nickel transport system permease protein
MVVRPMPYYIFAFALLLLLAYVFRWFPVSGGMSLGVKPAFTWPIIKDILWHAFLTGAVAGHPGRAQPTSRP